MASNTALVVRVVDGQAPKLSKEDIAVPRPAAHQVLVKLSHVAQNPTDGKISSLRSGHACSKS